MKIQLSVSYAVTFLLLLIVMLELHEIAHIVVGRLICGCWGERDFNVWDLCQSCPNGESLGWLATLAGPVLSFCLMWFGWYWLSNKDPKLKAIGYALIFANIPFGRITTVMMGGGDEMVVTRDFLGGTLTRNQMILLCSTVVLVFAIPPIIKAYREIKNQRAWLHLIGFLTLPLAFILVYILFGLNNLLSSGFLAQVWILGTPLLITLHTILAFALLLWFHKSLYNFYQN